MINETGAPGMVYPKVGEPNTLLIELPPGEHPGERRRLRGHLGHDLQQGRLAVPPRDLPIGQVSSVGEEAPYKTVEVRPLANLRGLETVQVLTARRARRPRRRAASAAALPPGQSSEAAGGNDSHSWPRRGVAADAGDAS